MAALVTRLLSTPPLRYAGLKGCASGTHVVILGEEKDLPWVDGASYHGIDPDAPSLLLPTHSAPTVHAGLLERALACHVKSGPCLVLPEERRLIPVAKARPLDRKVLRAWLEANR